LICKEIQKAMPSLPEKIFFLAQLFRDRQIAAFGPTRAAAVRSICQRNFPKDKPVNLVEYGPGTGVFTLYLAEYLHPHSHLLVVEQNKEFVDTLHKAIAEAGDKLKCRVTVVNGDARNIAAILKEHEMGPIDFALSGIPFSFLSEKEKMDLVQETFAMLKPDGAFLVYQFSYHMVRFLKRVFPAVTRQVCRRNFPFLYVLFARKTAD